MLDPNESLLKNGPGAKRFSQDSALILAGGRSVRMGYDKKKLMLGGRSVLEKLLAELGALFGQVLVSSNDPVKGLEVFPDSLGAGPLAGIYQGLSHCPTAWLYVIACDMPFLNPDYIGYLREMAASGHYDVCLTLGPGGRYEPFNAFYSKNCLGVIREALEKGHYQVRAALDRLRLALIDQQVAQSFGSEAIFFNINRPEDLEQAEASLVPKLSKKPGPGPGQC
ncbi:MAG: molybdenum cofactor guanylyltransferase [Deltaproteobacteria bacterium]|nr:molybdenum cofactor guanylyltransferase [Deltaproteobacteria bacterium]